jgi:hydrogenase maturation protease
MEQEAVGSFDRQVGAACNPHCAPSILVVGVGSPHGDDQLGWLVAKELADRRLNHCQVRIAATPLHLLDWIEECNLLYIVDACHGGGPAGRTYRWSWPCPEIQLGRWSGTHDFNLSGALALAEQLGRLPQQVVVWAVEGRNSQLDDSLSKDAEQWIKSVANQIQGEIDSLNRAAGRLER